MVIVPIRFVLLLLCDLTDFDPDVLSSFLEKYKPAEGFKHSRASNVIFDIDPDLWFEAVKWLPLSEMVLTEEPSYQLDRLAVAVNYDAMDASPALRKALQDTPSFELKGGVLEGTDFYYLPPDILHVDLPEAEKGENSSSYLKKLSPVQRLAYAIQEATEDVLYSMYPDFGLH